MCKSDCESVCLHVLERECVCKCVSVCVRVIVRVCVCMCERERVCV